MNNRNHGYQPIKDNKLSTPPNRGTSVQPNSLPPNIGHTTNYRKVEERRMNGSKLKKIIEMKFMGGEENREIRNQLNELVDKSVPISTLPFEIDHMKEIAIKVHVCPRCRSIVPNHPKYCSECGQRLF